MQVQVASAVKVPRPVVDMLHMRGVSYTGMLYAAAVIAGMAFDCG
jgi:phosphoribosylamine-glycine ligase